MRQCERAEQGLDESHPGPDHGGGVREHADWARLRD
jgi:hypothetical protein